MKEHDLDGCDVDMTVDPVSDEDLPYFVLFHDVRDDPEALAKRKAEYEALFGGGS